MGDREPTDGMVLAELVERVRRGGRKETEHLSVRGLLTEISRQERTSYEFTRVQIRVDADRAPSVPLNVANLALVGPARWTSDGDDVAVRLDVPHRRSPLVGDAALRSMLRHALVLAGIASPLPRRDTTRMLSRGRAKLTRALGTLGVDEDELLRYRHGLLVADGIVGGTIRRAGAKKHAARRGGSSSHDPWCRINLVADPSGRPHLRVTSFAGWVDEGRLASLNASGDVQAVRLVQPPRRRSGGACDAVSSPRRDHHAAVAVADIELQHVTAPIVEHLVWAVATLCDWMRDDHTPPSATSTAAADIDVVTYESLADGATRSPIELVDADDLAPVRFLTSTEAMESSDDDDVLEELREYDACDEYDEYDDGATDPDPFDGGFDESDEGPADLRHLQQIGAITGAQAAELRGELNGHEPIRQRRARHRIDVVRANRAARRDLTLVDLDGARAVVEERLGPVGPATAVALAVIDGIVADGPGVAWLLYGPPGVGKTRIVAVIAEALALGLHVAQLGSASGRQTFAGVEPVFASAGPGVFTELFGRLGTGQAVLCLDEVEKLGSLHSEGDASAALLAALDDHRSSYCDQFLGGAPEWRLDLRDVVMIGTANDLGRLSAPLRSRLRTIEVPGWTIEEKAELIGRELHARSPHLRLSSDAISFLAQLHAEPGVRALLGDLRHLVARNKDTANLGLADVQELFPPAAPTPVVTRRPVRCGAGIVGSAVRGVDGWHHMTVSARPNGVRWAGDLSVLGASADAFELHWIDELGTLLGAAVPRSTLQVEPRDGALSAPWTAVTMLVAVASAATGLAPRTDRIALVSADVHGNLVPVDVDPTDLAGLRAAGFDTVVVAAEPTGSGPGWSRSDLPEVVVRHDLTGLIRTMLPGVGDRGNRNPGGGNLNGYL